MNPFRAMRRLILAATITALGWWGFAPTAIGGQDTYIFLSGTSMLPAFRTGDLVVVRKSATYPVGAIAAYTTPQLKAPIFHRIIGKEAGRYIFKGENNTFVDPSRPIASEIVGQLWLDLGQFGKVVKFWRAPAVGATILGTSGMYVFWPKRKLRRTRLRRYGYGN